MKLYFSTGWGKLWLSQQPSKSAVCLLKDKQQKQQFCSLCKYEHSRSAAVSRAQITILLGAAAWSLYYKSATARSALLLKKIRVVDLIGYDWCYLLTPPMIMYFTKAYPVCRYTTGLFSFLNNENSCLNLSCRIYFFVKWDYGSWKSINIKEQISLWLIMFLKIH